LECRKNCVEKNLLRKDMETLIAIMSNIIVIFGFFVKESHAFNTISPAKKDCF